MFFRGFFEKIHLNIFGTNSSNVMRNFIDDLILVFFGVGVSSVITFVVGVFAARVLGLNDFGKYQFLFASAQVIGILMLFGTHVSSAKYISEYKVFDKKNSVVASSILIFLLSTILFAFLISYFNAKISHFFNIDKSLLSQSVIFAYFIAGFMFGRSLLQGFKKMKQIVFLEIANALLSASFFLIVYYLVKTGINYTHYYYATLSGYVFFVVGAFYLLRKDTTVAGLDGKIFKTVLHYCFYAIVGGISGVLLNVVNRIMLNYYFDYSVVGLFSAYSMASIGVFGQLINVFSTVFLPYVSSSDNKVTISKKLNILSLFGALISFFSVLPILYIVLKLMGNEYAIRYDLFFLFALLTSINIAYQIKMWYLSAHSLCGLKRVVQGSALAGLIAVLLMFFLVPFGDIRGVVWSMIIASLFLYVFYSWFVYKSC